MAELDNTVTVTLPVIDIMVVLAVMEINVQRGHVKPELKQAYENLYQEVLKNASDEALDEAVATVNLMEMLNNMKKGN